VTPEEFLAEVRDSADHWLAAAYQQGVKDPAFAEIVRGRAAAVGYDAREIESPVGLDKVVAASAEKLRARNRG
jgi:hypothetical protein